MDLLEGHRFYVAAHGIAAAYSAWLLGQFGATVDVESALDPSGVALFFIPGARHAAAPTMDVPAGACVITDAPVTTEIHASLSSAARERRVIWITPWGLDTALADVPATSLSLFAAGGWMASVGDADREPLAPPLSLDQFVAGLFATVAALAPEASNARPSNGLEVVSIAESLVATMIYDSVGFQYLGRLRGRSGNRFNRAQSTLTTQPCIDGHIGIHAALHSQWLALCELIGHPELATDPRFAEPTERAKHLEKLDAYLAEWLGSKMRWEAFHALQQARIPASAHPTLQEVLDSPQLEARRAWREVADSGGTPLRVPGPVARVDRQTQARPTQDSPDGEAGPWQEGRLRVIDLSMGWAGPLVTHILATLGADVIKVESHTRFDWWRGSRPPGDDLTLKLHERSHVFNSVNRGKRGLTLNLATPAGKDIAQRLIRQCDVLVENFGVGVMERLGLQPDDLRAANPGLVVLRQPGFGSDGPECNYLSFGNTIEGMSGLSALVGYAAGPPVMLSNALGDPVSGLTGAVAVLAALSARRRDGGGALVECSQLEGFLPLLGEAFLDFQRTGRQPPRTGNERPSAAFTAVVPCLGDDRWIAVEARDQQACDAILRAAGLTGLSPASLATWSVSRREEECLNTLRKAGVACAVVNNEADLLSAEPFASSGFWSAESREEVGTHFYPLLPITSDGQRPQPDRAAPLLGEHTIPILTALGYGASEIAAFSDSEVVGWKPAPSHARSK